ncbi:geranylgeranylglyceryl/heptaprenylglyceryl phosphate synthase [Adhaeribacter soli]|uniref:Geranylgeranylglyceryl phosphate synthase n=1 Tax=Adhaeribacter soli TaxID=2607655 RepID=A0A5N1IUX3_9BACT|nr:geranylgeranylglyceryl/heptaprenylglyceryl phosphate synthase [Adhaeribacter soli]KAA9331739.1 geranylgeranylglyceryl/heptaprenylglyceryl phosphate synthase [Adhaeribacter soli]
MRASIYKNQLLKTETNQKAFAVLLDPDNLTRESCLKILALSEAHHVDYFFMGGSLVTTSNQAALIQLIKENSTIPVILFPSNSLHIDSQADGILLLSLISGRNPDLLIGQHVLAAPILKASNLEVIPTGYMLVDTGRQTTASYMSGTTPLPYDKPAIAACTAMAGELLGMKFIYVDGGSGAMKPVSPEMIRAVKNSIDIPLIIGGGINTKEKAEAALTAGADIIVIGNEIEKNAGFLPEVSEVLKSFNQELV